MDFKGDKARQLTSDEIEALMPLRAQSAPNIRRHAATIHADGFLGSGVYAKSWGYEGILTARHCASEFATKTVALAIADEWHRVLVLAPAFEHVPVTANDADEETDLSFVIIRDADLIQTIKKQGHEFYDLDCHGRRVAEVLGKMPENYNWAVEGTPGETMEVGSAIIGGEEKRTITTTSAIVQGVLTEWEVPGTFDYIRVAIGSGFEDYPSTYKGVSGGGIWYQRIVRTEGETYVDPVLGGIVTEQSDIRGSDRVKVRTITGHGWVSIYGQVRLALARRLASERGGGK
jgi:hypothetical protein